MIEKKDVEKLAALARMTIPENEIEKVRKDIDSILTYVGQIDEANEISSKKGGDLDPMDRYDSGVKNVMREDTTPHESGIFTEDLLKVAPKTEDGYVKVKKIIQ